MCGIAGFYKLPLPAGQRLQYMKRMLAAMRHRGPDEMGYYIDSHMAMGTARLSILDLANGQQPIGDLAGRYWICFNGEIYNYRELAAELAQRGCRFLTSSDTEVLLHAWIAWGTAALPRLNGAFAFAIYDREERSLVLARDRYGKRPLYYTQQAQGIVFASEMKCLLEYEPFRFEYDSAPLASIFRIWTPLDTQTAFKDVLQIPAGAYLRMNGRSQALCSYAPLHFDAEFDDLTEHEAEQLVYEHLSQSVHLRLRSDVEVAAYLSGGLDSAIVTRLIAEQKAEPPRTFSIGFEEAEFDETLDQQALALHFGARHTHLKISARDIVAAFPDALWHAEVPVFRSAFVPMYLLSRLVRSHGIKVVMTGEGADEAFLGYDIFKETLVRSVWHELDVAARKRRLARLYPYLPHFGEQNQAALYGFFNQFSASGGELFSHDLRFHNSALSTRLLKAGANGCAALLQQVAAAQPEYAKLSPVQKAQWLEYKTLLGGYLLSTQGDRMSMAHSVENRCPFLDPKLVRLAASVNLRFDDGFDEKYILKKIFTGKLPPRVLTKPKQPYRAPDAASFLKARPDYLDVVCSPAELAKIDVLDTKFCARFAARMLAKSGSSISQAENQAFILLLSTALLHERFVRRNFPAAPDIEPLLVKRVEGELQVPG